MSEVKCKIDLLKPDLKAACDGVDSDDFMYTIKGYDACHEFDLDSTMELEYNLTCRAVNENGKVLPQGHTEGIGYNYTHLVSVDTSNLTDFEYKARNPYTNMSVYGPVDMDFIFDIRDFKYMSHMARLRKKITDPEVVAGLKSD